MTVRGQSLEELNDIELESLLRQLVAARDSYAIHAPTSRAGAWVNDRVTEVRAELSIRSEARNLKWPDFGT